MIGVVQFEAEEAILREIRAMGFEPAAIARRAFREEVERLRAKHAP